MVSRDQEEVFVHSDPLPTLFIRAACRQSPWSLGKLLAMVGKQRTNCNFGRRCRIGFQDESLHAIRIGDKGQRRVSRYQVSADALPSKPLLRNRRYGPSIEESKAVWLEETS